jgi:hypothetical protein
MADNKDEKRPYPIPDDKIVDLNTLDSERMEQIAVEASLGIPSTFQNYTEEVFRQRMDEVNKKAKDDGMIVDIPHSL